MAAGSMAADPQLKTVDDELTAIDKTYGAVSIAPRSKRSGKGKEDEPFGPELVPAAMPFAGDQRASIEHARVQILESGSFSGLLPAGAYTLGNQTFTVIGRPLFPGCCGVSESRTCVVQSHPSLRYPMAAQIF